MYLADVMGTVVMTANIHVRRSTPPLGTTRIKILPQGERVVAVDKAQAGIGDRVLLFRGGRYPPNHGP